MWRYWVLIIALLGLIAFGVGLVGFIKLIPSQQLGSKQVNTEAIVVLTGGRNRIEGGIALLAANPSKLLFISGVGPSFKSSAPIPSSLQSQVELGRLATSTRGNALETRDWVRELGIKSITIVTANYHMPRSLLAFKKLLPDVQIESYPVFSVGFKLHEWWEDPKTALLLCKEYCKYIATLCYTRQN